MLPPTVPIPMCSRCAGASTWSRDAYLDIATALTTMTPERRLGSNFSCTSEQGGYITCSSAPGTGSWTCASYGEELEGQLTS